MSEINAVGAEVATEAPVESIEATPEAPSTEAEQVVVAPETAPTYTVKVNGEDRAVTLEDLQKGYMLQGDYTRKTQELATQRQALAQAEALQAALNANPAATLKALQEAFGVGEPEPENEFETPEEKRLRTLENFVAQQEQSARQAQIDREIDTLHKRFGDFDENALFTFAVVNRAPDLITAYKAMNFDSLREASDAKATQAAKVEADTLEAKRLQAGVVHQAETSQTNAVGAPQKKANSIREALGSALKELGFSSMPRA